MAVLTAMPSEAIISAFKGVVDFYLWKGKACARKWPHWPKRQPYPEEKENQDAFTVAIAAIKLLDENTIEAWKAMAMGTPYTWRDLAIRGYMSGW